MDTMDADKGCFDLTMGSVLSPRPHLREIVPPQVCCCDEGRDYFSMAFGCPVSQLYVKDIEGSIVNDSMPNEIVNDRNGKGDETKNDK